MPGAGGTAENNKCDRKLTRPVALINLVIAKRALMAELAGQLRLKLSSNWRHQSNDSKTGLTIGN